MKMIDLYKIPIFLIVSVMAYMTFAVDPTCKKQNEYLMKKINTGENFTKTHIFSNESKLSIQMTWVGDNSGKLLLGFTQEFHTILQTIASPSDVYQSSDDGGTFVKITEHFGNEKIYIHEAQGIHRNPLDTKHLIIYCFNPDKSKIGTSSVLFVTKDGSATWTKHEMPFLLMANAPFIFHPSQKDYILAKSSEAVLFISKDGGATWKEIHKNVEKISWATNMKGFDNDQTIYLSYSKNTAASGNNIIDILINRIIKGGNEIKELVKSSDLGSTWKTILDKIYGFSIKGKFLYASEYLEAKGRTRRLKVSTDGGQVFKPVQLPSIHEDRFFSILDMEDNMVFLHVDDPQDTGKGVLYTSDESGVIFSKSLRDHFYPNFMDVTDFVRVASMKGTYMASQMIANNAMQSVITFNRGAEWKRLRKPANVPCPAGMKDCHLQITNVFSTSKGVMGYPPMTSPTAVGIILAHGHVADSLKTTPPDVFVSSNGGYDWIKSLDGPHHYQIADHGGLLVAVPSDTPTPRMLKFSTDEGRCWHVMNFTDENIHFTGLLTEPGNKAMSVAIWGYGVEDKKWRVFVVDFSKALTRQCAKEDYEEWFAHSEMEHPDGTEYKGCMLGTKEIFHRLKKDSLCANGYSHEVQKKTVTCKCTKDDYECEYGFSRPVNSMECTSNPNIKELDICLEGNVEKIKSKGYRRIPGDTCSGGFSPEKDKQTALQKKCDDSSRVILIQQVEANNGGKGIPATSDGISGGQSTSSGGTTKVVWILVGISVVLIFVVIGAVMVSRYRDMRRRHATFKFSLLTASAANQNDDLDAPLIDGATPTLYNENVEGHLVIQNGVANNGKASRGYHDNDSDVDLIE